MAGNKLTRSSDLLAFSSLTPAQQASVVEAFTELGTDYLKPVFDKLNGTVNYDELKIMRLCHLAERSTGPQDINI